MKITNNSISDLSKKECTGCRLCGDICPKHSILFAEDNEGFFYPIIDEETCISCGLCYNLCPALNVSKWARTEQSYAIYANDIIKRNAGSSGGFFGLLAEHVLNDGGHIWGAAFDENFKLVHRKADGINELSPLLKSKYIQSDLTGVYTQIKRDIQNGILTLFCGTPCQVNALKNYIGRDTTNLITVDFVCHGVPSQNLFDRCIQWYEEKHKVKIELFQFRYKGVGVKHPHSFAMRFIGEQKNRVGLHYEFPYYFGFQKHITLRPSCYQCKWACSKRAGDITLGDYWGIENFIPQLNAKDGISMILCNTHKGHELLDSLIAENIVTAYALNVENAARNNRCLQEPFSIKPERELFFRHLREWDFDKVVNIHLTPKRKWIFDLYYGIPKPIRDIIRKLMNNRMRYE